jgi:hypothetical protein
MRAIATVAAVLLAFAAFFLGQHDGRRMLAARADVSRFAVTFTYGSEPRAFLDCLTQPEHEIARIDPHGKFDDRDVCTLNVVALGHVDPSE